MGVEDGDGQEETGGRAIRTDDVSERCSVICLTRGGPPSLVSQSLGPGFGSAVVRQWSTVASTPISLVAAVKAACQSVRQALISFSRRISCSTSGVLGMTATWGAKQARR